VTLYHLKSAQLAGMAAVNSISILSTFFQNQSR